MTYMLLLNCALKLVEEIILYYDARSKRHQKKLCNLLSMSNYFHKILFKILILFFINYLFKLS